MKFANFSLRSRIELIVGDTIYDIHNNYVVAEVVIRPSLDVIEFRFARANEVTRGSQYLSLLFEGVSYLEVSAGLASNSIIGIAEIGFKTPGDEDHDWILDAPETINDHLYIRFDCDEFIRLSGATARVKEFLDAEAWSGYG